MTTPRQIYLLDPQQLPPETIAVTFARTSRSPKSFREIAAELTEEKSAEFHERWVLGYGHASIAEHAILHIAVENISRLAVETLESNRLASYTEKSTRYQKWRLGNYYIPAELENHSLLGLYKETCDLLFETYQCSLPLVKAVVEKANPRQPGETDSSYEQRIRSDYVDVCRYLLPASSLANVGMTINARALEHALRKMLSHPLEEVRSIGSEIKTSAISSVPTLLKYVEPVEYMQQTPKELMAVVNRMDPSSKTDNEWCQLVSYDKDTADRLLAAALFRYGFTSYKQFLDKVKQLSGDEHQNLVELILGDLEKYDIPLRELEHASFTFDLTLDQGAYYELKRHRMMTQTAQPLTTRLGFAIPRLITEAGFEQQYCQAMQRAHETYEQISAYNPGTASYIVPNGYNRRVLLTFNLRSADHLFSLRTASNAHFAIRLAVHRLAEQIRLAVPFLGNRLRCSTCETWQEIETRYFTQLK